MSGEDIKTKVCSKCGKELPMTDEYFFKRGNGYRLQCKSCVKKKQKEYYETHKDQKRERQKEYYETHKDQILERTKKYDEAHKEKKSQYNRAYYAGRRLKKDDFLTKWRKPCQKCGEQRLYLIQFHHIDPAIKEFCIGGGANVYKNLKIYEEEVKKCVCLCSNCHHEFHYFYGANPEDPVNAIKEYLKE